MDTTAGDTLDTVLERLPVTIAWCQHHLDPRDPRGCLRHPLLRPHPLEDGRKAVVESVARARYIQLSWPRRRKSSDLGGGRLLIYEPDINLAHGLEESESGGYVDVDNIPPWDTWLAYVYEANLNYLLSWVPGQFVPLVSAGIAVSPEQCIRWLDDTGCELRFLLQDVMRRAPE